MMGFYQEITDVYGTQTTRFMKQWAGLMLKLANLSNRRIFLLRCRTSRIIPKHVKNSLSNLESLLFASVDIAMANKIGRFIDNICKRTLSLEIKITCCNISKIYQQIDQLKSKLVRIIPQSILIKYESTLDKKFVSRYDKVRHRNINKFESLTNYPKDNLLFNDNSKWFKNISNIEIPKDITDFLSLGPKFGVPCTFKEIHIGTLTADIENIIEEAPEDSKDLLRARTTNMLTNFLQKSKFDKPSPINKMYNKTKFFLKSHPEIYILQADKGGCTVAMNKDEYIEKTERLLQNTTTYVTLNKDPTITIQKSYNELLKNLKVRNEIEQELYKKLIIYNSVSPKLYCLPKIHKQNTPLRPIVSSIGSVTYSLSRLMADILKESFKDQNDYNIKDTFSFVNNINGFQLPHEHVIISLDVVSLFTNIPLELVTDILDRRWDLVEAHTSMSKHCFLNLMNFIFDNTYFSFNNKFYKQVFGTPMGSPVSPILATIVLDHLFDEVIPRLPFDLPFIFKYVDDIVCAVPKAGIQVISEQFNNFNANLKFTIETENNYSVPFLDTKIIRTPDDTIILDWYQKPTSSGRYLNFYSNHPKKQKYNTVVAIKNRVTHISNGKFLKDNLMKLYQIFLNNGYPSKILKKLIFNSYFFDGPTEEVIPTQIKYKKLPYIENLTNSITALFKGCKNIKIAKYNSLKNFNLFSKVKDKTPTLYNSNVIYRLPCLGCQGTYIGQTSQWLKQRVTQHKSDVRLGKNSCAVVSHSLNTNHYFDYDSISILHRENNYKKRLFLEMYYINKTNEAINYKSDVNQLSNIYCNILK